MRAVVVYESHWGNTAEVARAIASGLGPDTPVLATDEATGPALAEADLIVAGAPVIAFRLATDSMRVRIAEDADDAPSKPDLTHPSMRDWLERIPAGNGLPRRSRRGSTGRQAGRRARSSTASRRPAIGGSRRGTSSS